MGGSFASGRGGPWAPACTAARRKKGRSARPATLGAGNAKQVHVAAPHETRGGGHDAYPTYQVYLIKKNPAVRDAESHGTSRTGPDSRAARPAETGPDS